MNFDAHIAVDIETSGLSFPSSRIRGIGVYTGSVYKWFPDGILPEAWRDRLAAAPQVYHNGKFDVKNLLKEGHSWARNDEDTLLLAALCDHPPEFPLTLDSLASRYLGRASWKCKGKAVCTAEEERLKEHNEGDVKATKDLLPLIHKRAEELEQLGFYYNFMKPLNDLLGQMETWGVRLDTKALKEELEASTKTYESSCSNIRESFPEYVRTLERDLRSSYLETFKTEKRKTKAIEDPSDKDKEAMTFNPASSQQIMRLFQLMGITPPQIKDKKTKEMKDTTSTKLLGTIDHPFCKQLGALRWASKRVGDLENWTECLQGDRIHASFNIAGRQTNDFVPVRTGRLSSSDPNLQNIHRSLRHLWIADEGCMLVGGDYGQIEVRVAAHFSQDPVLLECIRGGVDYYGTLVKRIYGYEGHPNEMKKLFPQERTICKQGGLAKLYGQQPLAFSQKMTYEYGIPTSYEEAKTLFKTLDQEMPGIVIYKRKIGWHAKEKGFVRSLFGRKVFLPAEEAEHKAMNAQFQGSASELTAMTQIYVQKECADIARLTLLIHDEPWYNVLDNPEAIERVKASMQHWMVEVPEHRLKLRVPLKIDLVVQQNIAKKD